jgi:hypothetical protein
MSRVSLLAPPTAPLSASGVRKPRAVPLGQCSAPRVYRTIEGKCGHEKLKQVILPHLIFATSSSSKHAQLASKAVFFNGGLLFSNRSERAHGHLFNTLSCEKGV